MAIQINTNIETAEGFTVQPFCYLLIQIYNPGASRCSVQYYKSEQDFIDGKSSVSLPTLPSLVDLGLTSQEFWGTDLATVIHDKCVTAIEEVTGPNTCTVISL